MGPPPVTADWTFARRPFWLFSHVFAATVIGSFLLLGLWQYDRHQERSVVNEDVAERSNPPSTDVAGLLDQPTGELDYRLVTASGTFVDDDLVRVANRTQGGVAGQHVVGLFVLDDGTQLLVNRGFVPLDTSSITIEPAPAGPVTVEGWLRQSAERGWLGATDAGEREVVPRLDVAAIAGRLDAPGDVAPVWLQLAGPEGRAALSSFPDPLPLATLDGGPHFSYMVQWFIFATLGTLFYGALLVRTARGRQRQVPVEVAEVGD